MPYLMMVLMLFSQIALGPHEFGRFRVPDAIVVRAAAGDGPGQVGFEQPGEGPAVGPWSFDVGADGTVWVADNVHQRLLGWPAGGGPRTVALSFVPLDIALAGDGTVYVAGGSTGNPANPRTVYAYSPEGNLRWSSPLTGSVFNTRLRVDGDGILHVFDPGPAMAWSAVTDSGGRPLGLDEQRHRTTAAQPLGRGRSVTAGGGPDARIRTGTQDWRFTAGDTFDLDLLRPAAAIGPDLLVYFEISHGPHTLESLIVRLSPGGAVLDKFALDPHATFGTERFTDLRVGRDGRLYQLQTSPGWGLRVARFGLAATPSPTPSLTASPSSAEPSWAEPSSAEPSSAVPSVAVPSPSASPAAGAAGAARPVAVIGAVSAAALVILAGLWLGLRRQRSS